MGHTLSPQAWKARFLLIIGTIRDIKKTKTIATTKDVFRLHVGEMLTYGIKKNKFCRISKRTWIMKPTGKTPEECSAQCVDILQLRNEKKQNRMLLFFLMFYFQVRLSGHSCIQDISDESKRCKWSMKPGHTSLVLSTGIVAVQDKVEKDSLLRLIAALENKCSYKNCKKYIL